MHVKFSCEEILDCIQVLAFTKIFVFASHTINVKDDFDSIGLFTCKSCLNLLNRKTAKGHLRGLNEILSK